MSDDKKERLNKKLVELIRDEGISAQVRLKKAQYLVGLGADVNAIVDGKSVLVWAKEVGDTQLSDFLEQKGAKEISQATKKTGKVNVNLLDAARDGDLQTVENLLKSGCDVNQKDKYDETALIKAIMNGKLDIAKILLQNGADPNARGSLEETALYKVAEKGNVELVKLMIEKGGDVNARNYSKKTALMNAAEHGNLEILELLLKNEAKVDLKDDDGKTAVDYAKNKGDVKIVEMIEKAMGEKTKITNDEKLNNNEVKQSGGFWDKILSGLGR